MNNIFPNREKKFLTTKPLWCIMILTDIIIFFRGAIMKLKKHILKLSILAAVLACAIIAGSMFALAN
jgi:hypothetical protein